MKDIGKYIPLFTKAETQPPQEGAYLCLYHLGNGKYTTQIVFFYESKFIRPVDYWLDLSKIISIDTMIEFAEWLRESKYEDDFRNSGEWRKGYFTKTSKELINEFLVSKI